MERVASMGGLRAAFMRGGGCAVPEAQKSLERPVPVVPRPRREGAGEEPLSSSRDSRDKRDVEAGIAELRRLLAVDCTVGSPPPSTHFGVSPPVRSGAANPMPQDLRWRRESTFVSTRSLQTLHELDRTTHFLRSSASCTGDWRLLRVASPDHRSSCSGADDDATSSVCSVSAGSRGRRTPVPPRASSDTDLLLAF